MGDISIVAAQWPQVEVGRVLLINDGPNAGKLATIVEIIDHKRVLVDGPSSDSNLAIARQSVPLSQAVLTGHVIPNLPRGARSGAVKAAWEKAEVDSKWKNSNWAKKADRQVRRGALTDFDRFKVMRLKKRARFEERKALAKVKASA
ncbi:hypothetical protein MCOR27_004646 [Pyricularia oryzae]|uniref:60S ribosomal protein L14-A-like protein n=5 Tax=Pyricularia TaxID=48558 RepID=Q5G587_PYRGI|nr:60S ribosomal protein L14, variant [Pyricularia oryzae 70-15]XP_003721120.1 60S ribosomal protein L14 [Pyricularia oryzae 70-15]XP_030980331.1 hypothetical protein PgNI_10751 [Pyricularia grisea]ADD84594.1 hypothetical protein [Pyricularia oryzae]AAW69343.1 60S ribosomal protein L14-A-like protein [Pyricularia grisea]EAQ70984.1 hypothetical protein MGCH7_ch7g391 [Pyricularia oryzae 70-15]EHA46376.1 60S ribosomal protein L14, variant [Pyricularia oryzae 70-15]EHA46377.1 60S ribosomal prote|eukprot:TRINITY_DN65040_c0_g1_i1.p1 TRINITY_DN65040_c0_g1~~TRINITY_DN65040_c0_g1_i1.p1  ORF type:complete len:147 (+),score=34.25 TRINITY_DN65040_c0_g1_i1:128-568(+)